MNRIKSFLFILCSVALTTITAQELTDKVLLTIEGENVTADEFIRVYSKNNNIQSNIDPKTVEEYLDLYINFRLKVQEAENLGLDTTPEFISEYSKYKDQLTQPYLRDKEFEDSLIQIGYYRLKNEVKASHILIQLPKNPSPEDTLKAYNKIMEIRQRILDGEDFSKLAKQYSEDPSAKYNDGSLGYFRAFQMVYPFEEAAFNTPIGEISMPVRTNYGYHIIQTNDIRPSEGTVIAAHIWVRAPREFSNAQKDSAKLIIDKVYSELENGASFEEMAKKYSDDRSTAPKGGVLPEFGRGKFIEEFTNAAFSLQNKGDYSQPVHTMYGWHLVKLIDKKPVKPFEELKEEIKNNLKKVNAANFGETRYLESLKEKYNFVEYPERIDEFVPYIDSNFNKSGIDPEKIKHLDKPMFKFNGQTFTQKDFANYMINNHETFFNKDFENALKSYYYKKFVESSLKNYEVSTLPERFPEYKYLLNEYHDGIILFDLTDELVWTKAVEDTTGLETYFEKNKENYKWKERLSYYEIIAPLSFENDKEFSKRIKTTLKDNKEINDSLLSAEFCDSSNMQCISVNDKITEKGASEKIDKLKWKTGKVYAEKDNEKIKFIAIKEILQPQPKALNECRGLVISDYQNVLEKEWINDLRSKYKYSVNEEVLELVKKKLE